MDNLFGLTLSVLKVVSPSQYSQKLTTIVNDILEEKVKVNRDSVLYVCKLLLLSDTTSSEQRPLAYVGKTSTPYDNGKMVVISVVQVTKDLHDILAHRTIIYNELKNSMKNSNTRHIEILATCCQLNIIDPTRMCLRGINESPYDDERQQLTFKSHNAVPDKETPSKRQKSIGMECSDYELPTETSMAASLLIDMHTTPPRTSTFITRDSQSTMSGTSDVSPLTPKSVSRSARVLHDFFSS